MSEWAQVQLKNILPVSIPGEWGSEASGVDEALVLRAADFTKDCKLRSEIGVRRSIPSSKLQSRILKNGDFLIEKSGGSPDQPVGRVVVFDREDTSEVYSFSNFLQLLRVVEGWDKKFTYYLLLHAYNSGLVLRYQQQTTGIYNLKLEQYLSEFINAPKLDTARKKIAAILETVDLAIEQTEALIAKYEQVKAGMMQDLFTRGLTPEGKLRPTRQQAPNQYQKTPIGWIPKEWDCECLEKLLANIPNNIRSGPFGSALLKSQLAEEGIAFLGIDNIHVERFDRGFRRFVDQKTFARLSRYAARAGDVIITIMGTVGRCAVFPDDVGQALSSKHLWTMTFDQDRYLPDLICWQLNYAPWVKAWFRRETQGGIMDAIQSKTLRNLRLPVPKLHEQLEIYKRYTTVSTKLDNEQEVLEKLRHQKSGLMHDLLTGTVAVKV